MRIKKGWLMARDELTRKMIPFFLKVRSEDIVPTSPVKISEALRHTMYIPSGGKFPKSKDPGVLAAEMGYDAINAVGHGATKSYTVVLNRTKLIIFGGENYVYPK